MIETISLQARLHRIFFRPQPEAQERMLKEEDQEDVDQCDATWPSSQVLLPGLPPPPPSAPFLRGWPLWQGGVPLLQQTVSVEHYYGSYVTMSPLPSLPLEAQYAHFSPSLREEMLAETKRMFQVDSQWSNCGRNYRLHFQHGYDNYMQHAWPLDELNPLACCGRGLASFLFSHIFNPDVQVQTLRTRTISTSTMSWGISVWLSSTPLTHWQVRHVCKVID